MSFILDRVPEDLRAPFIVALCFVCFYLNSVYAVRNTTNTPTGKRFLLVIAHPDDECMFFSPTLLNLTSHGNAVHVLCLSNGDADKLGKLREHELISSCTSLGVQAAHVSCIDTPDLQDSMTAVWAPEKVAHHLKLYLDGQQAFHALITFDAGGVSGHPNHASILPGIEQLLNPVATSMPLAKSTNRKPKAKAAQMQLQGPAPEIWVLLTTNILRKYIAILDAFCSLTLITWRVARSPGKGPEKRRNWMTFISLPHQVFRGQRAMIFGHPSQMRWFRWGWVTLSRYMYINELHRQM
ncbi:putative deacetylase LmbE-like domain-containing protein [Protomyces lactucae-debilis]|uniref:N-acetylglucosaminylphosphatidylinositol deacetylase n=1 Tax=Protomyces lactucae-debilis TaxID=2754530 RepID=A0A1Y2EW42_PROLT|nr:putative deacetylase LmbE-like domain-containing protein [Protomyces lactucae-debilis]ORY75484.1 putative deacetylase LmbE-like domain-containing protein [Protomyces lactucae-debilis]